MFLRAAPRKSKFIQPSNPLYRLQQPHPSGVGYVRTPYIGLASNVNKWSAIRNRGILASLLAETTYDAAEPIDLKAKYAPNK